MSSALVVGDAGAGLTTFVGLLYTAELRLGTELSDDFRFSADRETIRELEAIYGELVAGRFPERDVNWEEHPLSFVLGFRAGRWAPFVRGRSNGEGSFDTVRIRVGGISAQEIAELEEHDAILEESTRRLLRSPVVLPLVDGSRLARNEDEGGEALRLRFDRSLATTLRVLSRFLHAERRRTARVLQPLFVLTKFDRCTAGTLSELEAPTGPPHTWSSEARAAFGARVLRSFLPRTSEVLDGGSGGRELRIASPRWFFSSLKVLADGAHPRILRRSRFPLGAWEPEYPFEEYRALIEELGHLARSKSARALPA